MQQAVRTTIRIRKDLLNQSKMLAIQRGTSLQEVVNEMLDYGFHQLPKKKSRKEIMDEIDKLREETYKKHGVIDVDKLIAANKKELQKRTDRILNDMK